MVIDITEERQKPPLVLTLKAAAERRTRGANNALKHRF